MTFDPRKPFDDLPLLPPTIDLETRPVLKQLARSRSDTLVAHGLCERRTASKYLSELEAAGFLTSQKEWKIKLFINAALFELLKKS